MVFETVKSYAPDFQRLHFGVARQAVGFVVMVDEYCINRKPGVTRSGRAFLAVSWLHQQARWQVEIRQAKLR